MTKRIFWDKGHGGKDPGACANGLQEKELTHKIVEYAMDYMNDNYTGFEQKVSRTGDTYPTLSERAKAANAFGADVFVSVHINAGAGNGYESYVYSNLGASKSKAVAFQNVVNDEIMAAMRTFGDIKAHGNDDTREANYQVLRETKMTALLTENLYIDSSDSKYLKQESFLKAVGQAHARGVAKYLGIEPKEEVKKERVNIITGSYVVGSKGLADLEKFLNDRGWNYRKEKA